MTLEESITMRTPRDSLFASTELAARIERAESDLMASVENVLGIRVDTEIAVGATSEIVVSSGEDRPDEWMDVVVAGSTSPDLDGIEQHETFHADEIRLAESALVAAGSRRYLAAVDGIAVGGAGLRTVEGIAQLTGRHNCSRTPAPGFELLYSRAVLVGPHTTRG
jgi:hypothetical protein